MSDKTSGWTVPRMPGSTNRMAVMKIIPAPETRGSRLV